MTNNIPCEFSGERSRSYKAAIAKFPSVWSEDMLIMKSYLRPKAGERVLEIGAGSGFFSFEIARMVGPDGHLWVTDPSPEQLQPIIDRQPENVTVLPFQADTLDLPEDDCLDAIWSRGDLHHAMNKFTAFQRMRRYAKPGARLVILDVFVGSPLARYFDMHVARACTTGHEVSFLSREFAKSLCFLTGWTKPVFTDLNLEWNFQSRRDIGEFLALLHSNKPEFTPEESLDEAERILGVKPSKSGYYLQWPMTLMQSTRLPGPR